MPPPHGTALPAPPRQAGPGGQGAHPSPCPRAVRHGTRAQASPTRHRRRSAHAHTAQPHHRRAPQRTERSRHNQARAAAGGNHDANANPQRPAQHRPHPHKMPGMPIPQPRAPPTTPSRRDCTGSAVTCPATQCLASSTGNRATIDGQAPGQPTVSGQARDDQQSGVAHHHSDHPAKDRSIGPSQSRPLSNAVFCTDRSLTCRN